MRRIVPTALFVVLIAVFTSGAAANITFTDPAGDQLESATAPDITTVHVTNTPTAITIQVTVGNHQTLAPGTALAVLMDTDQDGDTGADGLEAGFLDGVEADGTHVTQFLRYSELADDLIEQPVANMSVSFATGIWTWTVARSELFGTSGFSFGILGAAFNADGSLAGLDIAPDSDTPWDYDLVGVAPPPPPKLLVSTPGGKPAKPVAGKRFTVGSLVTKDDMVSFVAAARVTCTARIGNAPLRATGRYRRPNATCAMTVPRNAKGKMLRGTLKVQAQGATTTKPFRFRVG